MFCSGIRAGRASHWPKVGDLQAGVPASLGLPTAVAFPLVKLLELLIWGCNFTNWWLDFTLATSCSSAGCYKDSQLSLYSSLFLSSSHNSLSFTVTHYNKQSFAYQPFNNSSTFFANHFF
jgi:hypothetical protein